jgi:AcrR family transcriptional regulator
MNSVDTRGKILDIANRIHADVGYSAVSMQDVPSELGVTQTNLYRYVKGKDELIRKTLAHVFAQNIAPMAELLQGAGAPGKRLAAFFKFFVPLQLENRIVFGLLVRERADGNLAWLKGIARSLLKHPFQRVRNFADPRNRRTNASLLRCPIVSIMLGHVQLAALLPNLLDGRPELADPSVVARHITVILRRAIYDMAREG